MIITFIILFFIQDEPHCYTGLPTTDETEETTVRNLYRLGSLYLRFLTTANLFHSLKGHAILYFKLRT